VARDDELNAPFSYLRAAIGAALTGDAGTARTASEEHANLGRWGRWVDATAAATEALALALEGRRTRRSARDARSSRRSTARASDWTRRSWSGPRGGPTAVAESDEFLRRARETFVEIGALGLVAAVDRLTGPGDRGSAPPRPDEDRGEVRPSLASPVRESRAAARCQARSRR